jgi:hypothetical protein
LAKWSLLGGAGIFTILLKLALWHCVFYHFPERPGLLWHLFRKTALASLMSWRNTSNRIPYTVAQCSENNHASFSCPHVNSCHLRILGHFKMSSKTENGMDKSINIVPSLTVSNFLFFFYFPMYKNLLKIYWARDLEIFIDFLYLRRALKTQVD